MKEPSLEAGASTSGKFWILAGLLGVITGLGAGILLTGGVVYPALRKTRLQLKQTRDSLIFSRLVLVDPAVNGWGRNLFGEFVPTDQAVHLEFIRVCSGVFVPDPPSEMPDSLAIRLVFEIPLRSRRIYEDSLRVFMPVLKRPPGSGQYTCVEWNIPNRERLAPGPLRVWFFSPYGLLGIQTLNLQE